MTRLTEISRALPAGDHALENPVHGVHRVIPHTIPTCDIIADGQPFRIGK